VTGMPLPQQVFPDDPDEKILFPLCIDAGEFVYLSGAVSYARDVTTLYKVQYDTMLYRLEQTLAYIETPENSPCFPLCDILFRKSGETGDGFALLTAIDAECGTTYRYPHFCLQVVDLIETAGETAETLYAALILRFAELCGTPPEPFPPFPEPDDLCTMLVSELTTTPTSAELYALLDTCGIAVIPPYEWEAISALTTTQGAWTNWNSSPYINVPDNRTRFAWSSGNGLITTYGTPGGGSPTSRHYLYGKVVLPQVTVTQLQFRYRCPVAITGTDQRANVFMANLGSTIYTSPAIPLINDNADHDIVLNFPSGVTADLFAIAVLGGTASGNPAVQIREFIVRGVGTPP